MPTEESKRVMDQRRRDYDRISFVVNKDAKYLIRARAMQEGVSSAEMIRRAILARCGLEEWPHFPQAHFHSLTSCNDRESAAKAIEGIQRDEHISRNIKTEETDDTFTINNAYTTILLSSKAMADEYVNTLLALLDAIDEVKDPWGLRSPIKFTKHQVTVIQRLLANIEEIPDPADEGA